MSTPLACGTNPDVLLAQVAEGHGAERDAHQQGCAHCQATLAEYARLWGPFDELAATATPAPPTVMDRALAAIRQQAGPPGWGRVSENGEPGASFLVAARAVVTVAGYAARTSPGVRMALSALGQLSEDPAGDAPAGGAAVSLSEVAVGLRGQSVAVDLQVAADYGQDLHALADQLRARVVAEVRAQTGLSVVEVDVSITDVFSARIAGPPDI